MSVSKVLMLGGVLLLQRLISNKTFLLRLSIQLQYAMTKLTQRLWMTPISIVTYSESVPNPKLTSNKPSLTFQNQLQNLHPQILCSTNSLTTSHLPLPIKSQSLIQNCIKPCKTMIV
ncbi:hypothetical protein FGO68_gene7987 [Halteria grandinella]|uniref:Uncharacterized protein n=1 Tax=Halteria grandinella TaxID=5974 RepID=A0A8J8NGD5_HALGN|nr:hypothetical protein FGO68_gene7987 [Halteria grandinella]